MEMTPKEKAIELVDKFARIDGYEDSIDLYKCEYEKQCALIVVYEMISEYQSMSDTDSIIYIQNEITYVIHKLVYWQEVRNEILKL